MKIQLVDRSQEMCDAWTTEFINCDDVVIYCDDFFAPQTDCIVSPANSFGFMDGGLDGVITRRMGTQVQTNVQNRIRETDMKELLVGQAIMVPTENELIPFCISAPTMRVPMILKDTPNVYLAAKAIFSLLKNETRIDKVTISGLGTGVGQVPYEVCAHQMKMAYNDVWLGDGELPATWYHAQKAHQHLYKSKNITDLQHD